MNAQEQNGKIVTKSVRREADGTWGVNVWFGHNPATNVRRYFYDTRKNAAAADIGDNIGRRGRVA